MVCLQIIQHKDPLFMNIYIENNQYCFSGVLDIDSDHFYLVFLKQHEDRIPLAVHFEISDETFTSQQFQLMFLLNQSPQEMDNLILQFGQEDMTNVYQINVSPSFPFPVDIKGSIKIISSI